MAKYSGTKAAATMASTSGNWGAGYVANNCKEWSGTLAFEAQDTTSVSDGLWRSSVNGHKMMTGTITMFGDSATALSDVTTTNPTVTLTLNSDATAKTFAFVATLEQISTAGNFNAGTPVEVTFSFRSNGAVTIT